MSDIITNASDASFDAALDAGDKLVLVDFWADWCGPCKAIAPALAELAEDMADQLSVVKVDIVANEAAAAKAGVQTIPLLILYRNGAEVERAMGAMSKSRLAAFVEKHL